MNNTSTHHLLAPRRLSRGLSLVELLVGVAVGLFIVGGATKMVVDNLNSNRRALLETRVNQDLRAAADLIARDLRRSGYWQNAASGVWSGAGSPTPNPHRTVTVAGTSDLGTIAYSYAKDNDDTLDTNEQFGYEVSASGVLQYQAASGVPVQPITDPGTVTMTSDGFKITTTERSVELSGYCNCMTTLKCVAADFAVGGTYYASRPLTLVREYEIRIKGSSATDPLVTREIRETVRVRNDEISGSCPTIL
jgi:prepilin peptidase dependent protein B